MGEPGRDSCARNGKRRAVAGGLNHKGTEKSQEG